jgi:hypothetical protein
VQLQHSTRQLLFGIAACFFATGNAGAQWGFWPADSLLAAGRLASAESAYYAASRAHPRDPASRAALGRFLAARGAVRVGAVLVEEAQFFGGDSAALSRVLVPMYVRSSSYAKLDSLRPNVLSSAEHKRVHWLATRPPLVRLGDSVVVLTYRPLGNGEGIGTVLLRIGKSEWPATIDPRVSGLLLPEAARRDVRVFGNEGKESLAVADVVRLGGVLLTNVPAAIGNPDTRARVGFDIIASYYPSFDPRAGLMTLRRVGRRLPTASNAARVPALFDGNGLRLLLGDHWQPTTASMAGMLLATRRWMWDDRRGDVLLFNDGAVARP